MPEIDLHGLSVNDAIVAVEKSFYQSFRDGNSELRIITGKGKIYKQVLEFSREHPLIDQVLNDGPLGSKYVGQVVIQIDLEAPSWHW